MPVLYAYITHETHANPKDMIGEDTTYAYTLNIAENETPFAHMYIAYGLLMLNGWSIDNTQVWWEVGTPYDTDDYIPYAEEKDDE